MGHALMENRHGLAVDGVVTQATGTAEREATLAMLDRRPGRRRITLGADKAYDVRGFVEDLRRRRVTPRMAIDGHVRSTARTSKPRSSAVDGRTTRHPGYRVSQRCRKCIEEVFGWAKSAAGLAKVKLRGRARVEARLHPGAHRLQPHPPAQAPRSRSVSVLGKWRIVEMPDCEDDFPDMMEPAYILFEDHGSGEFAFGCVTGQIFGGGDTDAVEFHWTGNDEMDEAQGHVSAELRPDGSLEGQICFHSGGEANFIAHRWTSSTA